jgi:hypothetical protein
MTRFGMIASFALTAMLSTVVFAEDTATLQPRLRVASAEPMLVEARSVDIVVDMPVTLTPDPQTTASIGDELPKNRQLAYALEDGSITPVEEAPESNSAAVETESFTTGTFSVAPVPTPRPDFTGSASVKKRAAAGAPEVRTPVARAKVKPAVTRVQVAEVREPIVVKKRRTLRSPGPVFVGAYN